MARNLIVMALAASLSASAGAVPLSRLSKAEATSLNPFAYCSRTVETGWFELVGDSGERQPVGAGKCAVTAKNKLTVKTPKLGARAWTFSGAWTDIDPETGLLSARLASRQQECHVALSPEGALSVWTEVGGVRFEGAGRAGGAKGLDRSLLGTYHVIFPVEETDDDDAPSGAAFVRMTVDEKAVRTGLVRYSGVAVDGTSFSGSATAAGNADGSATLSLWKSTGQYTFASVVVLEPPSRAEGGPFPAHGAPDVVSYVRYRRTATRSSFSRLSVVGSRIGPDDTPASVCRRHGIDPESLSLEIATVGKASLRATGAGFGVRGTILSGFAVRSAKNGQFSGTADVIRCDGSRIRGSLAGVLLPDCAADGLVGAGVFAYKVKGIKIGLPVLIERE